MPVLASTALVSAKPSTDPLICSGAAMRGGSGTRRSQGRSARRGVGVDVDKELLIHAQEIVAEVTVATAGAPNEASLRHELEKILERHCCALGIPWVPFQLERTVNSSEGNGIRFVDVAHGAVIVEYEAPGKFSGREGIQLQYARGQVEVYGFRLHREEGRPLSEYVLVAWDGSHISFGHFEGVEPKWGSLTPFNLDAALRLLLYLKENGSPLVHPKLLSQLVGPESNVGSQLIPLFFQAIRQAASPPGGKTSKTKLLFFEWRRLFGQVVGIQSDRLKELLRRQSEAHSQPYADDTAAYLFALNTYIALVAKLVAALSLPNGSEDLTDPATSVADKIEALESGRLFSDAGISNMLIGDFFSWYRDDPNWDAFVPPIQALIVSLSAINFDVTRKNPDTTRDLFKGMYQTFVPKALRHALGEYYTPDWLAAHALDVVGWNPEDGLLDPTCGSGTFILEALRRRLIMNGGSFKDAHEALSGLYGIDLNPLAVLAARASLVVFLSPYLDPSRPLRLPIFLADAINTASASGFIFEHSLQTELGVISFTVPRALVGHGRFYDVMMRIRELVEARYRADDIYTVVNSEFDLGYLSVEEHASLRDAITTLVKLHNLGWDGIWTAVLADRFAAAAVPPIKFVVGNPPWVKWSHLPPEYAAFIKKRCVELGVFSQDVWVGGIESDISTVITYEVIDKWLAPGGKMAFFITGTVFTNESSQGFRRFHLKHRCLRVKVLLVEDFDMISPFEGVTNHPTLLVLERDQETEYPVPYRMWRPPIVDGNVVRTFGDADEFRKSASCDELLAAPVPGTEAGPWLKGTKEEHEIWRKLFGPETLHYKARKGVTTDRNGIFFVKVLEVAPEDKRCKVRNDPSIGRDSGIPTHTAFVEIEHVFPLLRGRNVKAFSAVPDSDHYILLPQRGMHGDPNLPTKAPGVYRFLRRFKETLEERSSYRRFQQCQPYWSVWSTGPYTFSEYKVLWKEMPGGRFAAAYIGKYNDPLLGEKVVIPDHKLYFVPLETEDEAAYLAAILNSPTISRAVTAYAAQLSLGVSVVEYLKIPVFDHSNPIHRALARLAKKITRSGGNPTWSNIKTIDHLTRKLFGLNDILP